MMLRKISEGEVVSDSGFSVKVLNADCILYSDSKISLEMNLSPKGRTVFVNATQALEKAGVEGSVIMGNMSRAVELFADKFVVL